MKANCIFCEIIANQKPEKILYQDEYVTAFRDIHPLAPVHILIVPNRHMVSVNDVESADEPALGRLFTVAKILAEREGIARSGYRLVVNSGPHAGQGVFHLHMHLMGGQRLRLPIG